MEYELQAQKPGDPLSESVKKQGLELIDKLEQTLIQQGANINGS
jgi:hypothetical protein